ncbi:kinase/pyrophosphorylase [Candidatus Bathyarchaeota archaeon]|nr:kinase/pyrophosphorylase [Candidatus Bathyarchaeota archaeon]
MENNKSVFLVSDATGLTAETVVKAILLQFKHVNPEIKRITRVRNRARLVEALQLASKAEGIIFHTLVSKDLRNIMLSEGAKYGVPTVDLLGPVMNALMNFFDTLPAFNPGLQHELSEGYFRGIECIEYTINHDDGRDPNGLFQADLVIVGVSRTSKTPLSIFISNQYALCVANIPIILGVDLPQQLFNLNYNKIVGLTITPERLQEIRKVRIQGVMGDVPSEYANYNQLLKELEYSHQIYASKNWPVIDVTEKSIEEIAAEILELTNL